MSTIIGVEPPGAAELHAEYVGSGRTDEQSLGRWAREQGERLRRQAVVKAAEEALAAAGDLAAPGFAVSAAYRLQALYEAGLSADGLVGRYRAMRDVVRVVRSEVEEAGDTPPSDHSMELAFVRVAGEIGKLREWAWGEVATARREQAVASVAAALKASGDVLFADYNRLDSLRKLCGEGPTSHDALLSAYEDMRGVCEAALDVISDRGGEVPTLQQLAHGYVEGHRDIGSLGDWWSAVLASREAANLSRAEQERKARERQERLERQDQFLRAKARERCEADGITAPRRDDMSIVGNAGRVGGRYEQEVLDAIAEALEDLPCLRHVLVWRGGNPGLWVSEDRVRWRRHEVPVRDMRKGYEWMAIKAAEERTVAIGERALITDAFGMDPMAHWGKTRGALMRMLKPSDLDLLHRQDVMAALERARAAGRKLVVIRSAAFLWDEQAGEWQAREVIRRGDRGQGQGSRLWTDAEIVSTNHGRIIVLPYVKADGTAVEGHTRNPPHEGRAEPREVALRFKFAVYDELGRDDAWDHEGNVHLPDEAAAGPAPGR